MSVSVGGIVMGRERWGGGGARGKECERKRARASCRGKVRACARECARKREKEIRMRVRVWQGEREKGLGPL